MASDVTLWGHWTCPYVNRVDFALGQRGIHHELVSVPPSAVRPEGFVLPTEFVEHSPLLEVPMVRVDGEFRVDSIPLLFWLEERVDAPTLLPAASADIVCRQVESLDEQLMRAMGGIAYGTEPAKIDRAAERLADTFAEMNDWLEGQDWLAGDEPTFAEAIAVPIYLRLDGLVTLGFDRPIPDRIEAHRARTLALAGGVHVAWNDDQAAEYLGRHRAFRSRNT